GGCARVGEANRPALDVVRRARALTTDPAQALELAVTETRLLLKAGQFAQARITGDSLLRETPLVPGDSLLAGVAIALGRPAECSRRLQHLAHSVIGLRNAVLRPPGWVAQPSLSLLCYSAAVRGSPSRCATRRWRRPSWTGCSTHCRSSAPRSSTSCSRSDRWCAAWRCAPSWRPSPVTGRRSTGGPTP